MRRLSRIAVFAQKFIPLIFIAVIATSCRDVSDIDVVGVEGVSLRGLNKNIVTITIDLKIDNPNNRKITITEIYFDAWLNNREFGTLRSTDRVVITPCSREVYPITVEVELRTIADGLRVFTTPPKRLLSQIEVEGYIKGRSFPIRRTLDVPRQPFDKLTQPH